MSKKLKILIAVLVILVIFFIYSLFFSGNNKKENNLSVSNNVTQTAATVKTDTNSFAEGQEVLDMLGSLKSLKIDTDFFNDKTFKSLVDFSIEITPQPAGRSNPFSPI
ncbi:MAG: hypothetical protein WC587_02730 [Candidatus Paceibacterota bacterium]